MPRVLHIHTDTDTVIQIPGLTNLTSLPATEFKEESQLRGFDTILVSCWSSHDTKLLGDTLANAVDRGVTVVFCLYACKLTCEVKGRFTAEGYWPVSPCYDESAVGKTLGFLHLYQLQLSSIMTCFSHFSCLQVYLIAIIQ
jgi:hypothetical protein